MKRASLALSLVITTSAVTVHADTDWQLWGGVAALGAGAITFGLGYYESARIRESQKDPDLEAYRRRWPSSERDSCARAREGREGPNPFQTYPKIAGNVAEICDDVERAETRQLILYTSSLAFLTTGLVLLATRPKKQQPATVGVLDSVSLTPMIGPRGSAMSLTLRF